MDAYIAKYDTFTRKVVFDFPLGHGGIGDLTKFLLYLLQLCIENDVKLYCLRTECPVYNLLKLRYDKMYISYYDIDTTKFINNLSECSDLTPDIFYLTTPYTFYSAFEDKDIYLKMPYLLNDLLYFTDDVKRNAEQIIHPDVNYISIHLRQGDKYLESYINYNYSPQTYPSYMHNKEDMRPFDESHLYSFIENNAHKTIYFFCDNNTYKQIIKNKYNFINITDYKIGHTGLYSTTPEEILNSVTDFYLLANSEHIYTASDSGFSKMAAKFKNTPITPI
jgi:hypothetical protein